MADQRDEITAALMGQQNTGGLTPQDFDTFSKQLGDPSAVQSWLDAGGVWGQYGGKPPDPDEQYFAYKGVPSGSATETGWMAARQPWQQGGYAGGETTNSIPGAMGGWMGGASMTRADPSYWGWLGPYQGYAPGSMGDISGFNSERGSASAGGTGGLSPADFAVFSRLLPPENLQEWLNAGGVQGMADGGMGGSAGGGGSVGGGGGSVGGGGGGVSNSNSSVSNSPSIGQQGYSNAGYNPGDVTRGPDLGNTLSNSAFDSGLNQAAVSTYGAFGPPGFGPYGGSTYSGQPGYGLDIGTMGQPGQGTNDGWGYGADQGDSSGSGAW